MSRSLVFRSRWLLPIDRPPIDGGWVRVEGGRIAEVGHGATPASAVDLGDAAVLPALVNAHTHLELSWMAGRVPPAAAMHDWIRAMLRVRATGPPGGETEILEAMARAAGDMHATGTCLVGDVSNTLLSPQVLAKAGLGGVVFHELLGFNASDPEGIVRRARARAAEAERALPHRSPIRLTVVAHAPYSVSPPLFRAIARNSGSAPLSVHLGESPEEIEFLRTGQGPIRRMLEDLGAWAEDWRAPGCDPVQYLADLGYLRPGVLVVHAVHLTDRALERLRAAGVVVVTCPRSNEWVGAGMPRVARFLAAGVPVAIGTDSLASSPTLNLFDELAELRRIAPDVSASSLLESATRVGADALGFEHLHGTLGVGKRAALLAVDIPNGVNDVEEYLVGGVPPSSIRRVSG